MDDVTSSALPSPGTQRALPVPDGLEGQRVDQALSRLFGLSRTVAAEIADAGNVVVDGRVRGKGDRLSGGSWLEVELPAAAGRAGGAAPGRGDDDPARRRRHRRRGQAGGRRGAPEPRLGRADRGRRPRRGRLPDLDLRGGRAAGRRAPPGRRHDRGDGRRQERARLHLAEGRVQGAHGRQGLPRARPGPPRSVARHHRRADRPPPEARLAVRRRQRRPPVGHPLRGASRRSRRRAWSTSGSRPGAPTRSGCTSPPCGTRASATRPTAPTRRWPPGSGSSGSGCTPSGSGFAHPADGRWVEFTSEYPPDLAGALAVLRAEA